MQAFSRVLRACVVLLGVSGVLFVHPDDLWVRNLPGSIVRHRPPDRVHLAASLERGEPLPEALADASIPVLPPALAVGLPVPFTPQAPSGEWDLPFREACEEASVLMALHYAENEFGLTPLEAEEGIRTLVRRNERVLGDAIDESAVEVRDLLVEVEPSVTARLLRDPSLEDLQRELAAGNPIIVPVLGERLRNPSFRQPPPRYHMLVLRGYTEDRHFITNEPGMAEGDGHLYSFDLLMEAMHDLPSPRDAERRGGDVRKGEKVVIVVEPMGNQL